MDAKENESPTEDHPGRIEIQVPKGFSPPSESEPGKPFDVVDSWEVKPDGKTMCLVRIGDSDAPGYGSNKESDQAETKPDYKPMAANMASQMSAVGGDAGGGGY